jgi:hypothetical protein
MDAYLTFIGGTFVGILLYKKFSNMISLDTHNKVCAKLSGLQRDMNMFTGTLKEFANKLKLTEGDTEYLNEIIFGMEQTLQGKGYIGHLLKEPDKIS